MPNVKGYPARQRDALLRAALSDLGERGTIDYGYAYARGTRRVWRAGAAHPESVRIGIGYALHATCHIDGTGDAPTMHYARSDARDGTRTTTRGRVAYPTRIGTRTDLVDADTGRKVIGAIVTGATRTRDLGGTDASNVRVRALQRDARTRMYVREGAC
jgi:hypothetical protein